MITKAKIKKKLKERMNRVPKKDEIINAYQDSNLIQEIILDELTELDTRLKILENK